MRVRRVSYRRQYPWSPDGNPNAPSRKRLETAQHIAGTDHRRMMVSPVAHEQDRLAQHGTEYCPQAEPSGRVGCRRRPRTFATRGTEEAGLSLGGSVRITSLAGASAPKKRAETGKQLRGARPCFGKLPGSLDRLLWTETHDLAAAIVVCAGTNFHPWAESEAIAQLDRNSTQSTAAIARRPRTPAAWRVPPRAQAEHGGERQSACRRPTQRIRQLNARKQIERPRLRSTPASVTSTRIAPLLLRPGGLVRFRER